MLIYNSQSRKKEEFKPVQEGKAGIYACGPTPMLRALKDYAAKAGIPCYLSLEQKMACGIGACLACVCESTQTDDHSKVRNKRICVEGPVFEAGEIVL